MTNAKLCVFEPYPNFGGGSEQICLDLAIEFAHRGVDVFLLHDEEGTMLPRYQQIASDIARLTLNPFGWKSLTRSIRCALKIRRQLARWGVQSLLCSNIHYIRTLAMVALVSRVKVVFHLGLPLIHPMWSRRIAYRAMACGISPSKHTVSSWREDGWPESRLQIVPNWVDPHRFRPITNKQQLRAQLGLPAEEHLVCYVGRLVREKGIETLLRAAALVNQQSNDTAFVLVGGCEDGSTGSWPELAAQLKVPQEKLRFAGRRQNTQDYLAAADLAVVPSEWPEPFGLTVLEAMASGTPPIVTNVGILADIVGIDGTSLVVSPGQPDQLADRIGSFLSMPASERCQLGNRLRERAVSKFHIDAALPSYSQALFSNYSHI